jgi:hypothetical protein
LPGLSWHKALALHVGSHREYLAKFHVQAFGAAAQYIEVVRFGLVARKYKLDGAVVTLGSLVQQKGCFFPILF